MELFDTKIALIQWTSDKYWYVVCNPDWSLIWGWATETSPYKMLAYYDETDLTYNYSYYAEALPGTLTSEAKFRCFKVTEDKDWNFISKIWAWILFNNLGDETSVKALTYN